MLMEGRQEACASILSKEHEESSLAGRVGTDGVPIWDL